MNKETFFRGVGEIEHGVLERYDAIDAKLAREHRRKQMYVRMIAVAACLAILLCACLPVGFLIAHPMGKAVLTGDSEMLLDELMKIDGFSVWQSETAEKLEQNLPAPMWELLQTTPVLDVLTQPQFKGLAPLDSFEGGEPYRLYFLSNGDGTCTLKYITTNPAHEGNYEIEIPEISPKGDVVTAIDINQTVRSVKGQNTDFPYVLTPAMLDALVETAQANRISAFDLDKLKAYYLKLSAAAIDEQAYKEPTDLFPIAAVGEVYVFDVNATEGERSKIYAYLTEYCEWNTEKYDQSIKEIMRLVKREGDRERAELYLTVLRDADLSKVTGITIPKTVSAIDPDLWVSLLGLETVTVAADNPVLKMIDGCLIDTETGTLKLYLREDGKFPESADIRILDSNAFALCTLQPNADGSAELYIPEGVTEIRKDCFTEISFGAGWSGDVYLPESLQTFGGQAQGNFELIYHYPGTMEEWERRVTFTDVNQKSYIYLVTTDSNEPIRYVFMKD